MAEDITITVPQSDPQTAVDTPTGIEIGKLIVQVDALTAQLEAVKSEFMERCDRIEDQARMNEIVVPTKAEVVEAVIDELAPEDEPEKPSEEIHIEPIVEPEMGEENIVAEEVKEIKEPVAGGAEVKPEEKVNVPPATPQVGEPPRKKGFWESLNLH